MLLAVLLGLVLVPAQSHAAWWWPFGTNGEEYRVEFEGLDSELSQWFDNLKLNATRGQPVETEEGLEQELALRGDRVRTALAALGYYDAVVRQEVRRDGEVQVLVYMVQPGPRYRVGKILFEWSGGEALKEMDENGLRTRLGEYVNAQAIMADSVDLLDRVGRRACLLALDISPLVRLYEGRRGADVVFRIKHGAVANFGPTQVTGNDRVNTEVVLRSVSWKQGRCYNERRVDDTRTQLVESQLFSSVDIRHPAEVDANGEVPMTVNVTERAARTMRAGVQYSTDEGVVLTSGWEHRNLMGGAEKFNADFTLGQEEQGLKTTLRLPGFLDDNANTLILNAGLTHEERDAYTSDKLETGATLERTLGRWWKAGAGVTFRLAQTDDILTGKSDYALLGFPAFVEYDSRRNVLDPRSGMMANVTATPYTETIGDGGQFLRTQGSFQTYVSAPRGVNIPLSPTLAFRVAGGMITGGEGVDVPSDLRFYAGGGGSVRGYGYQSLGPRVGNEPVGGSSFVATSLETRLRFTEDLGGVVFADAGNAYDAKVPDYGEKLYTSAGIGVRYYTAIGPIRADLAFPMNGQDIGASKYAFYISIGQSF
ncbi:MAG: hypothetical protein EON60_02615 [Alphaproteobacteria bacterium]|nr:MAG: hypothetical protein EON60_02615 [Alphaproteobacteria bacterium]